VFVTPCNAAGVNSQIQW